MQIIKRYTKKIQKHLGTFSEGEPIAFSAQVESILLNNRVYDQASNFGFIGKSSSVQDGTPLTTPLTMALTRVWNQLAIFFHLYQKMFNTLYCLKYTIFNHFLCIIFSLKG